MTLTQDLLASDPASYRRATQSAFLRSAAAGSAPRDVLGRWLANDRLYIHAYIRGVGRLLGALELPDLVPAAGAPEPVSEKLLQWLVDALVNVRREERFFVDTARRFGIEVNLPATRDGVVAAADKLEGLRRFEELFGGVHKKEGAVLGWLEGAVLLYATEKCYLDAWSGARDALEAGRDAEGDADGGALRREFIPNWSSTEFQEFVDGLGRIIDEGVEEVVKGQQGAADELRERALGVWREVLLAEEHFWPAME